MAKSIKMGPKPAIRSLVGKMVSPDALKGPKPAVKAIKSAAAPGKRSGPIY